MLAWMVRGMTIKYTLELVVKAQGNEGVTTALLPPIQFARKDSLFNALLQAKYMVFSLSPALDEMDEDKLLDLASRVEHDVVNDKYKWQPA